MVVGEDPMWKSIRFPSGRTIMKSDLTYMSYEQRLVLEFKEVEPIGEHRYIVKEATK